MKNDMILLDGKKLAQKIKQELKDEIKELKKQGIIPHLGVILVGEDPPSIIYVRNKENACFDVGITTETKRFSVHDSQKLVINQIREWNKNRKISGILVQLPLPEHFSCEAVLSEIEPSKDVDGLSPDNLGRLITGKPLFYPCTPLGIIELLSAHNIPIEESHCVIIGRGALVGKPLANMLLLKQKCGNATVTVCHSRTRNLTEFTRMADILIVAIGKPEIIKEEMIKERVTIIDVGVNRIKTATGEKLVGDVDFLSVKDKVSAISPVPGGVGPMTVAMLLKNTVQAAKMSLRATEEHKSIERKCTSL